MTAALSLPFEDAPTEPSDPPAVALLRTALALLRTALELVSAPAGYDVVYALAASDAQGARRHPTDPLARRFGLVGSLLAANARAGHGEDSPALDLAQLALCRALGTEPAKGSRGAVIDDVLTRWYHSHGRNWPSSRQARELLTAAIEIARRVS